MGTTELSPFKKLASPPVIRADKINYQDQSFASMLKDRDPVDAAVIEALWRVRGTGAAVANTGARFLDITKLDDKANTIIANEARTALTRLVNRGDIQIKKIDVSVGSDWAEVAVHYLNMRASKKKDRVIRKRFPEEVG